MENGGKERAPGGREYVWTRGKEAPGDGLHADQSGEGWLRTSVSTQDNGSPRMRAPRPGEAALEAH